METRAAAEASVSPAIEFVRWEEVFVSTDKGRRKVHYNLKRNDGSSDLAVIGKEKSLRHMSYHYAIQNTSLLSVSPSLSSSRMKLKSRRDVVDWLNSIVKDSHPPYPAVGSLDCKLTMDVESCKKQGQHTKEFLWQGCPWNCDKRRRHYPSFIRNGVKISVHDFVYVLAEEDKRLVAYLKDLYEDSRGNRMVMVQWFHKIDEVGIALPHSFNDREIFFSLCTQRLSIECIDGLATVLSPQQFEKYLNEATHNQLEPFVCQNQFENGEVKPFDITRIKGYWNQEILRVMCAASPSKAYVKSQPSDAGLNMEENFNRAIGIRPKKKQRRLKGSDVYVQCSEEGELMNVPVMDAHNLNKSLSYCETELMDAPVRDADNINKSLTYCNNPTDVSILKGGCSAASLSRIDAIKHKPSQHVAVGSQVEVLSQDSGIRGCWFRALIIKTRNDRVKVRYLDLKDAENEANSVEEWILSSRVAASDHLGMWSSERKTIRPAPQSNEVRVSWVVDVGAAVDAWRHDGWWEGLVIRKETEDKLRVYFPGEKQVYVIKREDLRHSQEWIRDRWIHMRDMPELVTEIISNLKAKQAVGNSCDDGKASQDATCHIRRPVKNDFKYSNLHAVSGNDRGKGLDGVLDLSKDDVLAQMKWKRSRKRRRGSGSSVHKLDYNDGNSKRSQEGIGTHDYERLLISSTLKVDLENCKYIGDSLFSTSVVPHLTSMVMSR